jgi:O-antigen/teichoic acid export membrane protein
MKKNYLFNLLLSVANILFPIISFPYVSRTLGPTGVGKVQFIISLATYFSLVAALGIPIYGIREIAKYKDSRTNLSSTFSELIIIYFITSSILTLVYLGLIAFVPYFGPDRPLFFASTLLVILGFTSIDWLYAGLEQFKVIAIRSVLIRTLSLALMFIFIRNASNYYAYLMIIIFTTLSGNLVNVLLLKKNVNFTFRGLAFKRHFAPLLFIFGTTIATSMYTMLDTVLLGFLADDKSVGLYSAAVKLSKIAIPVVTSLGIILVPKLSKSILDNDVSATQELLDKSFDFIAFFSIPLGFGLALLAPELITAFSSSTFLEGTRAMQVLATLPFLIGFGYFFGFQVLLPGGKDKEMLISVIGGVLACLVLNFLLVPHYKHFGASLANVGSEAVVTLIFIYFAKKHYTFRYSFKPLLAAFLSCLVFYPAIAILRACHMNLYVLIAASSTLCAMLYFALQKLIFKNALINNTLQPFLLKKLEFLSFKNNNY